MNWSDLNEEATNEILNIYLLLRFFNAREYKLMINDLHSHAFCRAIRQSGRALLDATMQLP